MSHTRATQQAVTIAAVVLLVYGLVRLLQLAVRCSAHPAVQRQLQLADERFTAYTYVASHPPTRFNSRQPVPAGTPVREIDYWCRVDNIDLTRQYGHRHRR